MKLKSEVTSWQRIERLTRRTLTIHTSLVDNLDKCHAQDQSPLYSVLPKELRDMIFKYATAQYEDLENKYDDKAYYCRPGHRAPLKTSWQLLLTCRRVFLETYDLPMRQAEQTLWMNRGPKLKHFQDDFHPGIHCTPKRPISRFIEKMTILNRKTFGTAHFFMQMYEAEHTFVPEQIFTGNRVGAVLISEMNAKTLHITIRHTDWWYWESDEPLRLDVRWVQSVLDLCPPSISTFKLELETLQRKKGQLAPIVTRLTGLEGEAREGSSFTKLKVVDPPEIMCWSGPTDINGEIFEIYDGLSKLDYHVETITWTSVTVPPPSSVDRVKLGKSVQTKTAPIGRAQPYSQRSLLEARLNTRPRWRRGWRPLKFRTTEAIMREESNKIATNTEHNRRQHFERTLADVEVKRLMDEWKLNNSLLTLH